MDGWITAVLQQRHLVKAARFACLGGLFPFLAMVCAWFFFRL